MQRLNLLVVTLLTAFANIAFAGEISTALGTGEAKLNVNAGDANMFNVGQPFGVEIGPLGGLYVTEVENHRVIHVDRKTGKATTVAGTGEKGYSGDRGPATAAQLNEPYEVRFDAKGNMYFVEMMNHLVRYVEARSGQIHTIAGTGEKGYGGDGGPAIEAKFNRPHSIAIDNVGKGLYIADIGNHRIRRVDLISGKVETVAGTGGKKLPVEGQLATGNPVLGPRALYLQDKLLWVALREGHSIWYIDLATGKWHHVAGTGKKGFSGDGGSARSATFNGPKGIAIGPKGNVYVVDTENHAIRKIDPAADRISTIAGMGPEHGGGAGDGGPATKAQLARPHGVCVDAAGNVFIGDTNNHRVRMVVPD